MDSITDSRYTYLFMRKLEAWIDVVDRYTVYSQNILRVIKLQWINRCKQSTSRYKKSLYMYIHAEYPGVLLH